MTRLVLLSDAEGFDAKAVAKDFLASIGRPYIDMGVFRKNERHCGYRGLVDHFLTSWDTSQCKHCIAFSRTGNEFQIWANRHPDVVATPIVDKDALETIRDFHSNMCDIYSRLDLQEILNIVRFFVDAFEFESPQALRGSSA
jgi:ribose 5-phosphate isomerase RpiB